MVPSGTSGSASSGASWVDLFFTTDVHILGLGLGVVEMHLWWVLTYRARQMAEGLELDGKVFFNVAKETGIRRGRPPERRLELLRALKTEVI